MTKSGVKFIIVACAALMCSTAGAQTRGGFEVGVELFDYGYRERLEGETIVTDDGLMAGLSVGYVETLGSGWFLRALGSGSAGDIDYASESGKLEDVEQEISRFQLDIGRDFRSGRSVTLTPFVGLGGRLLEDNGAGTETQLGFFGYDREIFYAYVSAGITAGFSTARGSKLAVSARYDRVFGGDATSKLSGIDPELPDLELDLDGGHGLEASVIMTAPVGRRAINFGPFVRHWNIDRSESFVITNPEDPSERIEFFEPKNRTTELGVRLSFSF